MLGPVARLAAALIGVETAVSISTQDVRSVPRLVTLRGACRPLGATVTAEGVNFAVFSRHANTVSLLLYEEGQGAPYAEIPLDPALNRTGDIWHVLVQDLGPGVLYGYRAEGPFAPRLGHRFHPRALLVDPYARALADGHPWGRRGETSTVLPRLGKVIRDEFDWEGDTAPNVPLAQSVIYEVHVRGFTQHPSSGIVNPGTFLGLCEKIPYLKALGVTAVQLMPVLEFDEEYGQRRHPRTGEPLCNYWGYSPLSFFALKAAYAKVPGGQIREFKQMVKRFHQEGFEVILDVVFNHTCEGNENGPTFHFRGLDNSIYYMLDREGRYLNYSGCGNTLNANHPVVRDLILDSLIELVAEYHVDGFRFDLAAILGRGTDGKLLDNPPILEHIAEHPILARTKLFAEAWDAAGVTLLGKFPAWGRWAEFNGHFRDDIRRFIRSEGGATAAVAKRITGSLDLYGTTAKHPYHSINFVTCHDGFTLNDLVTYLKKHNEANGEDNHDGWDDNISFNCGIEGPSNDVSINALRQRQMRNFLILLMISQGVPFLVMGDEFGRTQRGNNNAYCQDNEVSWVDWSLVHTNASLIRFTSMLIALRKKYFALTREQFLGRVVWHGTTVGDPDWTGQSRTLALQLLGGHGYPGFHILFNSHWEPQRFSLPSPGGSTRWRRLIDTHLPAPDDIVEEPNAVPIYPADYYHLAARSVVMLMG